MFLLLAYRKVRVNLLIMNHLGKPISEGSKIVTRDAFARFFRLMTNNDRDTDSVIHELFEILDENSRGYLVSWSVRAEFI